MQGRKKLTVWIIYFTALKKRRIKQIGVSNHNLQEFKRANEILNAKGLKISAVQNYFSLLHRSSEKAGILDYCKENNIIFFSYMVLEQGALTGKEVDSTFRMFPPFYTDFGKNTVFGKNVFVNSSCHFQDQGGITIGDGILIGHNVVLAAINHDLKPRNNRKNHYSPIMIGNHVWIGSNATVL